MRGKRKIFHEIAIATTTVAVCTTFGVTWSLLNINSDALKVSAREYASSISENLTYKITSEIVEYETALREIINIFGNPSLTLDEKIEFAQIIMSLKSIEVIGVYDNMGIKKDAISTSTKHDVNSSPTILPDILPENMYKCAIEEERFYGFISQEEGHSELCVLVPWQYKDRLLGFLYTKINLLSISDYIRKVSIERFGKDDLIYVFDRNGNIVIPLEDNECRSEFLKHILWQNFISVPQSVEEGQLSKLFGNYFVVTNHYQDEEKGKMVGTLVSMPTLAGAIFIQHPYWMVYWGIGRMRRYAIIVGGVTFLFAVLLASLLSKYISRPVAKLTDGANKVAQNDFNFFIEVKAKNEIGELANRFNEMVREVKHHRDHLEELVNLRTEELQKVSKELARSNKELEQFAYVVSHDLQEPLRMVSSYMQLLERRYKGKLDTSADEFIGYAVDGASRMREMINALLSYARVGTRGKPFEPIDCKEILNLVLTDLKLAIEESEAVITYDSLPTIMGDNVQLKQLFQNLIGNAIKFRREKEPPRINLLARENGDYWLFSLHDNGIGIDPQYVERVFQIFQRLHTQKEYPGTGIGLAICKKIVERHGGRIWVESKLNVGSIFYFTIPKKMKEKLGDKHD